MSLFQQPSNSACQTIAAVWGGAVLLVRGQMQPPYLSKGAFNDGLVLLDDVAGFG
ncbi:MAG: hypothetical protein ACJA06_002495 [Halocynthiibacter sp.]